MKIKVRTPVLLGGLVLFVVACGVGFGDFGSEGSKQQPLSETFEAEPAPWTKGKALFDCTNFEGNSGCESDLCLRISPGFPPRGICSMKCRPGKDADCPQKPFPWSCAQIFPSSDEGWVCMPPLMTEDGGTL